MINVAVLGYGTVGSGVVEVINTNKDIINNKIKEEINVKYVLDLREFPGDPVMDILTHDYNDILNDPEVEIVAEVMGGVNPAYEFVKSALEKGKSVCTSNKELVAKHVPELIKIAREHNRNFFFEASVGGGIPIIRPLNTSVTADDVLEITGILNGTTNFILTKMSKEGSGFDEVLKEAQDLGYAEKNPSADVDGFDACRKISILASLVYGKHINFEEVYTEGITKITDKDFVYANKLNSSIKLFGSAKKQNGKLFAYVAPMMITSEHTLYSVNGVFNAIMVKGNVLDDIMFYGSGAGKLPTASAVVSDVVDAIRHLNDNVYTEWEEEKLELSDFDASEKKFFVRVENTAGKEDEVKASFGDVEIVKVDEFNDEFGFITSVMSEKEFNEKVSKVSGVITRIRME